jgi:hypothetical protein
VHFHVEHDDPGKREAMSIGILSVTSEIGDGVFAILKEANRAWKAGLFEGTGEEKGFIFVVVDNENG